MALPVYNVIKPSALSGQTNGRISPVYLRSVKTLSGGPPAILVTPADRSWNALQHAARDAGHHLRVVSSYRTYEHQRQLFVSRYTTTPIKTTDTKWWEGRRWYKLPGVPVTAPPGDSNHGWALAIDAGEEEDGDVGSESLDNATLAWLLANCRRFGFSWEIQSERWHIRYFHGDAIPAATLAFENGQAPRPPVQPEEDELAGPLITTCIHKGQIHRFFRDKNDYMWMNIGAGDWVRFDGQHKQPDGDASFPLGKITCTPFPVSDGETLTVTARGTDGQPWQIQNNSVWGGWRPWAVVQPPANVPL